MRGVKLHVSFEVPYEIHPPGEVSTDLAQRIFRSLPEWATLPPTAPELLRAVSCLDSVSAETLALALEHPAFVVALLDARTDIRSYTTEVRITMTRRPAAPAVQEESPPPPAVTAPAEPPRRRMRYRNTENTDE